MAFYSAVAVRMLVVTSSETVKNGNNNNGNFALSAAVHFATSVCKHQYSVTAARKFYQ